MRQKIMKLASGTINAILVSAAVIGGFTWVSAAAAERAEQLECLALNIYHEARGESILGQIAVAQVTMNRVDHSYFPDTVCSVVWQRSQFSWTNDGRSDEAADTERYEVAMNIAETVYDREEDDPTNGALFYHATYINAPSWTRQMEVATEIGVHVFYNWDGTWD